MRLFEFFQKKKSNQQTESFANLTLDNLKVGWMVDYDLKTWEVTARHYTDWGDGWKTEEWQLTSFDDTIYLEKSVDDDQEWCISRKINFNLLDPVIADNIINSGDPPQTVTYQSVSYHLKESGGGHFFKDGIGSGHPMLAWDYCDDSERKYLTIEQWGEKEFEAAVGEPVETYQFTNILPIQIK
jgi:hypothetical protein